MKHAEQNTVNSSTHGILALVYLAVIINFAVAPFFFG